MIPWYAPVSFKEYGRRLLTLRSALVLSALVALTATELHFNWVESIVGSYLTTTNYARPESGTIWDQGHQSELARQTLNQYTNQRQDSQREARRATCLGQVLAGLGKERGVMISAAHFVELYLKLPPVLGHEIISPYTLLSQMSSNKWQRTFFEQQEQQLSVYLLDDHNQVLYRLTIGPELIEHIQQGEIAVHTGLHQLGDFAAHIYPAEQFFSVLNTMPEEVRKGVLASPEDLLRMAGRIVQVGISSESLGDTATLGFEIEELQGPKVILTQGRKQDVEHLLWMLESASGYGFSRQEEHP